MAAQTMSIGLGPYISPSRPNTGVVTAAVNSVTVIAHDALLLAQLRDVPDERRSAAFVSACALVYGPGDADSAVVRGAWPGAIAREPRGAGGFGYDPLFIPEGESRSAAELSPEEKDAASHRGRALALLIPALRALV
jgi:XTP/dITP diphosphohydrolase